MNVAKSRISQARLDQVLVDIRQYITGEHWQIAMKQLSSIRDYAMGEEQFCSADAALENCEQIKGYFPEDAPESVRKNLDAVAEEIRQIQAQSVPALLNLAFSPLAILLVAGGVIYWFIFR